MVLRWVRCLAIRRQAANLLPNEAASEEIWVSEWEEVGVRFIYSFACLLVPASRVAGE